MGSGYKTEGTSQTYGQLVIFPTNQDSVPIDPKTILQSGKDIIVKLITTTGEPKKNLNFSRISDIERSKISVAAFSNNKQAFINLSSTIDTQIWSDKNPFTEVARQEFANISSVNQNIQDFAIVVGGSKGQEEVANVIRESKKADLFCSLKSQPSQVCEYNNLKDLELDAKFVYNFYTTDETDIISQEDQSKDPLIKKDIFNVPRYVKLTWETKHVTQDLSNIESDFLRAFPERPSGIIGYGSYNFKDSFVASSKRTNLVNSDGSTFELIDLHKQDIAFASTNNSNIFTNTLNIVLDSANNSGPITSLPIAQPLPVVPLGSGIRGPVPPGFISPTTQVPLALHGLDPLASSRSTPPLVASLPSVNTLLRATVPNASFQPLFMATTSPHLNSSSKLALSVLAESVSDVSITRGTPKGFETIAEFTGIEYVGYKISKERLIKETGEWHLVDEYRIIGSDAESFIDTRVAYGQIYRYRMRTIFRLTQKEIVSELIENNYLQNVETLIIDKIKDELKKNELLFQNSEAVFNRGLSNPNTKVNNVTNKEILLFGDVYANFNADRIDVFQKTPGVVSLNTRTEKNSKLTSLSFLNGTFNVYLPIPDQKLTQQKVIYKSYYFESLPGIQWKYVDIYEDDAPPAPQSIKVQPNTLSNQIIISWLRPSDSQRDIAAYRIYRRTSFGTSWTRIAEIKEIDVNDDGIPDIQSISNNSANLFIDKNVDKTTKYIYALACVDIHGIESFLSVQIQAELNPNFKFEKEEKPLKWISGGGATPQELNFVYKKFLARTEAIIVKRKIKLRISTKFKESVKKFIIRVTSLDTHEIKEYKMSMVNSLIPVPSVGPTGKAGITPLAR